MAKKSTNKGDNPKKRIPDGGDGGKSERVITKTRIRPNPETQERRRREGKPPLPKQVMRNLSFWEKGHSGNPSGRRKGYKPLAPMLRKLLNKVDKKTGKSLGQEIVEKCAERAAFGDDKFARLVFDRVDGKAPDATAQRLFEEAYESFLDDFLEAVKGTVKSPADRARILERLGLEVPEVPSPASPEGERQEPDDVETDPEKTRQDAIRFYTSIRDNPTEAAALRLKAQERLDVLLGHLPDLETDDPEELGNYLVRFVKQAQTLGGAPASPEGEGEVARESGRRTGTGTDGNTSPHTSSKTGGNTRGPVKSRSTTSVAKGKRGKRA